MVEAAVFHHHHDDVFDLRSGRPQYRRAQHDARGQSACGFEECPAIHFFVYLDDVGRPSFNLLQNDGSNNAQLIFYVFDALLVAGRESMAELLERRRDQLNRVLIRLALECCLSCRGQLRDFTRTNTGIG